MNQKQFIIFFLLYLLSPPIQGQISLVTSNLKEIRVTGTAIRGDTLHSNEIQKRDWSTVFDSEKYSKGNWLVRAEIVINDSIVIEKAVGLFVRYLPTAYKLYWDDVLLIDNGTLGANKETEIPGVVFKDVIIPPELLQQGNHSLVLRVSNHREYPHWRWYYGQVLIANYRDELRSHYELEKMIYLTGGVMLVAFILNLFLYFGRGFATEHLLLTILCFITLVDRVMLQLPLVIDVPTTYIPYGYGAFYFSCFMRSILFPSFIVYFFNLNYKKVLALSVLLINSIIVLGYTSFWNIIDVSTMLLLGECLVIAIYSLLKKKDGSIILLAGVIIAGLVYYTRVRYFGAGTVLAMVSTLAIAREFIRKEREERAEKLKSARLEIELLKKTINPHFIFNSLTSIIAWLRKDPENAIKLIEALSQEFRLVIQIYEHKLIPIEQELQLCRQHLNIMGYRYGKKYKLETRGIKGNELIPPMIFHTIVENGLTHDLHLKSKGIFLIVKSKRGTITRYSVQHNGECEKTELNRPSGVGMRYVKTRLEECYPNRWSIRSYKNKNCWKTIIEIIEN